MADIEKVIRDLEYLVSFGGASQQSMVMQIATDALVTLRDQNQRIWELLCEKDAQPEIIRCKDCKHRPIKPDYYENGFDLEFPDGKCPCQCVDDGWYSWFPSDEWFCANGELKD